ncbi:MAG: chromosome segregation protein [Halobacteriales archaeon]|jgi:chromosome segregation protein
MHIKELVLENFKSFGRKTRIPFYDDFTTISGPNGSGKSNIIDAVLFALGLARTRGIRAEKLTDLIYNPGHEDDESGAGPTEASVTVVLDNGDRALERSQVVNAAGTEDVGDVDEINVKRRVKETEDNYYSYYYLNGRSVNLSDIQDLLAQAGVTPEGYNVVMQGDVTDIISMTPGSRREIIDEIAGVAEFDAKKEQAFEELEVVEERIGEAELRIEEKAERLEQLEDERETALEYQGYRDEKEEYEGYLKAAELADKRDELERVRTRIEAREDELDALRTKLDEKQGRVVRLEEDLEDLNAEIERKGEEEQLEIKSEIERIKGEIERLRDKIEDSEERIEAAESERRQAFVKVDRKQEEIDDLEEQIKETKLEQSSVKADLKERKTELEGVEAEIDAVDTEFDELKADLQERKEDLEAAKTERNELQREQDRLLDEARRRSNDIDEVEEELDEARERLPELEAELQDLADELEKARANERNIEGVVEDLTEEKRAVQSTIDDLEDELQARQQEYAELEAKADRNGDSSFPRSVTTVLNADLDGVHGAVAQLGGVDPEYSIACETAASGRLANVVVDDDAVGQRCIDYLKSRNAGRATFLPLTEMHERSLPVLPEDPGVIDFAYNLVDFDEEYAGVFSYVLGDTVVVEDLETAREYMGDYRMVTLEGDLVEKSGAMTGGSKKGSRYSFSKSGKGRLERLAETISELEEEREELREEIRSIEERIDDARDRKADAADEVREIETEIESTEGEIDDVREEIDDYEDRLEELRAEREDVDDRMQEIDERVAEKGDEIAAIENDIEELEAELEDSRIPELTEEAESLRDEIDALEDRMDDLDGQLNEYQLEKEYAEESIEDLHETIEEAQNRKAEQEERIEELEDRIGEKEALLEEKRQEVLELEDELSDLKAEREELRDTLQEAQQERDDVREEVNAVENDLSNRRETAERLEWEIEELEDEVGEHDPDEVPDHDTVTDRIEELEAKMSALEPVNMLAIDEYDEVQAELEDLQAGKETLVEERDGIEDRIDSYEAQKKATFMEAFEAIDAHFQAIFQRLSNGTGQLYLENEADPFDGGLTMKARPGDKPVQRLDAMSGGEKSLTALAFIFAIQRYNPAPFYALDEIDAFLDAANAERVGEMVDELAEDAQFVVVSHRSAMLDRSERAIGVMMQEENVSSVTGIDLSDGTPEVPADD